MVITMQDNITEELDNLAMYKSSEKYELTHLISTIIILVKTNKILMEKIKTLTPINGRLISNRGHQKK